VSGAPLAWEPSTDVVARANVTRMMRRHDIGSIDELRLWAVSDVARFWDAVVADLEIPFSTPYDEVLDTSAGVPWARWFAGGRVNVSEACVDVPARRHPGRLAVVAESEDGSVATLTYAELAREIAGAAAALRAIGVRPGDRLAVFLPPCAEAVVAAYAVARVGAIYVPLFSGFGAGAVRARLTGAGVRVVITGDGVVRRGSARPLKPVLDEALEQCPDVEHVLVVDRLGLDVARREGRDLPWTTAPSDHGGVEPTGSEDPFMLIHTSGTTGPPKGALHVHGGFLVKVAAEAAYQADVGPDDVACWVTDMGWIMGPWLMIGCHARGATMVLYDGAPDRPTPNRLWELVERHGITVLGVSPTLVRALMAAGSQPAAADLSSLRILASGGEPWNRDAYRWLMDAGGGRLPIINLSGGTEVGACFLSCHPVEPIKECSLGGPALGMDVDVLDGDGRRLRGAVGELVCRQPWPGMTRGLWRDPEGYVERYWSTYEGVWTHGDWALVDDDGAWFLLGRSDDVLSVAGKRVGPAELESVLVSHPAVMEAAAIGVPDLVKGEVIWCFCIPQPGLVPGARVDHELRKLVASELGRPYTPARIAFVPALPRTRSGKIVRRAIRACVVGDDPGDLSALENPEALQAIQAVGAGGPGGRRRAWWQRIDGVLRDLDDRVADAVADQGPTSHPRGPGAP
jgi:acetyl-CoA synthetase